MKKYEKPVMEVEMMETDDIMELSNVGTGDGDSEEWDQW